MRHLVLTVKNTPSRSSIAAAAATNADPLESTYTVRHHTHTHTHTHTQSSFLMCFFINFRRTKTHT